MNTEAKVRREDKLKEAVKRMQKLKVREDMIENFLMHDLVPITFNGVDKVYGLNKGSVDRVSTFEKEHNALVYYILFTATSLGDMESYLFVSDYEEEWEMDHDDLESNYAMTWTNNLDHPEWSEFGSIAFSKSKSGALMRTS